MIKNAGNHPFPTFIITESEIIYSSKSLHLNTYTLHHIILLHMATPATPWKFIGLLSHDDTSATFKISNNLGNFALKIILPDQNGDFSRILQCPIMFGTTHQNLTTIEEAFLHTWEISELQGIFDLVTDTFTKTKLNYFIGTMKFKDIHQIQTVCVRTELSGPSLRTWLNKNASANLTPEILAVQEKIIQNIISGITILHKNNIVHGHLYPENIFFTYSDKDEFIFPIKLGCFDTITNLKPDSVLPFHFGRCDRHLYYHPGENTTSNNSTQNDDIYAVGLILYEIMELIPYFDRKSRFENFKINKTSSIVENHSVVSSLRNGCDEKDNTQNLKDFDEIITKVTEVFGKKDDIVKSVTTSIQKLDIADKNETSNVTSTTTSTVKPPEIKVVNVAQEKLDFLEQLILKYTGEERYDIAAALCEDSLQIKENTLPINQPKIVKQLESLVLLYEKMVLLNCMMWFKLFFNYVHIYFLQKNSDKIETYLKRILEINESDQNCSKETLSRHKWQLALHYFDNGKSSEASTLFKNLLDMAQENAYGLINGTYELTKYCECIKHE